MAHVAVNDDLPCTESGGQGFQVGGLGHGGQGAQDGVQFALHGGEFGALLGEDGQTGLGDDRQGVVAQGAHGAQQGFGHQAGAFGLLFGRQVGQGAGEVIPQGGGQRGRVHRPGQGA